MSHQPRKCPCSRFFKTSEKAIFIRSLKKNFHFSHSLKFIRFLLWCSFKKWIKVFFRCLFFFLPLYSSSTLRSRFLHCRSANTTTSHEVDFRSSTLLKPDLYYEKSLRHAMRQALRQACRGNPCRNLSQRLIAKVEPGSTFATAIVRRVRQHPIFMTPSFVSLGTSGNFARESGEGSWGWWHVQVRHFLSTSFLVTAVSHLPTRYNGYYGPFLPVILSLWDVRFWWGVEWPLAGRLVCTVIKRHGHDCEHRRGDVCGGSEALPMLVGRGIPRLYGQVSVLFEIIIIAMLAGAEWLFPAIFYNY